MSLGGIIGKLIGGLAGGLLGGGLGGQKQERQAAPAASPSISSGGITPQKKVAKAGRLALIKTKRTGVFDEGSTSGRGKLFGN